MISRILLVALCSGCFAADCVPVSGERILAVDLGRAVPAFAALPPELSLGYAPAPGARRTFSAAELARLAKRYGVTAEPGVEACVIRPARILTREQVAVAMQARLPNARIEVLEVSRQPVPAGDLLFSISDLSSAPASDRGSTQLWRGHIRKSGRDDFPVWAKVRIVVSGTRAVATEQLLPGRPIERAQIRIESYEGPPGIPDPAQIIGRAPRRPIAADTAIEARFLEEPEEVQRGESVRVEVLSGRARLVLEGRAQSSGRRGEMVAVRNPSSGKIFRARVQDRGQVSVAPGWSAPEGKSIQ